MCRRNVTRTTKKTNVTFFSTPFSLSLASDRITSTMKPSVALYALNYKIALLVSLLTDYARGVGSAGSTLSITFLPARVKTRIIQTASLALSAPFALPGTLRHYVQRRIYAIDMVANIALVAENQASFVVSLATTLKKYFMMNEHGQIVSRILF